MEKINPQDDLFRLEQKKKSAEQHTLVIAPLLEQRFDAQAVFHGDGIVPVVKRTPEAQLEEVVGLAHAISLNVVYQSCISVKKPQPSTLFGSGKVQEIAGIIKAEDVELVIVDHPLTPIQQRNLEKEWHVKVMDRTGLILEIFGDRAQTKEGRLQVELAHLKYQKGRLVRSWTHLERQRGGAGFMGGPGETQIESDRRLIQGRIKSLEKALKDVVKTRQLHRRQRKKTPHPVVALVGYTNAGKSTLFNRITSADVYVKDELFATLDPTLRRLRLPQGTRVIFSDTVGFVSDLPHDLVAAFRATLEEVIEADLILHVRDISQENSAAEAQDVKDVLRQLDVDVEDDKRIIEVWNKIDRLDDETVKAMRGQKTHDGVILPKPYLLSAVTGEGVGDLLDEIEARIGADDKIITVEIAPQNMGKLPWIYENLHIIERDDMENGSARLKLRVPKRMLSKFEALL